MDEPNYSVHWKRPHLSLKSAFSTFQLPPLTVLTGPNGAGKTHFLRAIEAGAVEVGRPAFEHKKEIQFFDAVSLVPKDTGPFQFAQINQRQEHLLQQIANIRERHSSQIANFHANNPELHSLPAEPIEFYSLTAETIEVLLGEAPKLPTAIQQVESLIVSALNGLKSSLRGNPSIQTAIETAVSTKDGRLLTASTIEDVQDFVHWETIDAFEQSFAQIFTTYNYARNSNIVKIGTQHTKLAETKSALSDSDFIEAFGEAPWIVINRILREAGLDFEVGAPSEQIVPNLEVELRKCLTDAKLKFGDLSSGERTLMSFALCLYNSQDRLRTLKPAKVFLFDEIDASLHPAMARQMLDVIQNVLIRKYGAKVIMTTHSPTTVAVAPERSIYVMNADGPTITKTSKQKAISILTSEIPTLSLDFEGRRQVFVESSIDAEIYSSLYQYLAPDFAHERSITFIPYGMRNEQGEEEGGCTQVKKLVNKLIEAGNKSVFGLIDRDNSNRTTERVHVVGEQERYAIENFLYDPLLIATLLVREDPGKEHAFNSAISYNAIGELDCQTLQMASNQIQRAVLDSAPDNELENPVAVGYNGGFELNVSRPYLDMRGKNLEEALKEKFPLLKRFQKNGELMKHIARHILRDHKHFIPKGIVNSFIAILEQEV